MDSAVYTSPLFRGPELKGGPTKPTASLDKMKVELDDKMPLPRWGRGVQLPSLSRAARAELDPPWPAGGDAAVVAQPNGTDAELAGEGPGGEHGPYADVPGNTSDGADFAYDPSRDLSQLKTYAFAQDPAAMLKGKPGSVHTNVFVLRQLQREVTYVLADKGLEQETVDEADFLISIDTGERTTAWYTTNPMILPFAYGDYYQRWRSMNSVSVPPRGYMEGTLGINFIDRKSGTLLWHGWTTQVIPLVQENDAELKKAVQKVLGQY